MLRGDSGWNNRRLKEFCNLQVELIRVAEKNSILGVVKNQVLSNVKKSSHRTVRRALGDKLRIWIDPAKIVDHVSGNWDRPRAAFWCEKMRRIGVLARFEKKVGRFLRMHEPYVIRARLFINEGPIRERYKYQKIEALFQICRSDSCLSLR